MTTSSSSKVWSPKDYPESVMDVEQDSLLSMVLTARRRLVSLGHNDVHDELAHLCDLALGYSPVTTKPLIFYGDGMRTQSGTGHTTNATTHTTTHKHTQTPTNTQTHTAEMEYV